MRNTIGTSLISWMAVAAACFSQPPARQPLPASVDLDVFFEDAFTEALEGERPDVTSRPQQREGSNQSDGDASPNRNTVQSEGDWARLISKTTLEDEVKAVKSTMDQTISTPGRFQSGGYKIARTEYTSAAVMFAIIAEFPDTVRWQDSALNVRDALAKVAANAKVGTIQVFNEARLRQADLMDLLNGSRTSLPAGEPGPTQWQHVCDRSPLMLRLEVAAENRLNQWTRSAAEIRENASSLVHEAEIVAAFAQILQNDQMEDGQDEDYEAHCRQMQDAALQLRQAVKDGDAAAVQAQHGRIRQSCSACHEIYR
ncbi:MAG: cytochrome c [Pirellulaceae bacterium]